MRETLAGLSTSKSAIRQAGADYEAEDDDEDD
jgi:hypothetical protein